jgi:replicative DNA helicase
MQLSASLSKLKRKAKLLSRKEGVPLHEALDRVASDEGFCTWSLLVAKASKTTDANKLFACLRPGDLLLVGARPGEGKTLLSLELAVEAMKTGCRSAFFTLDYTERDIDYCFQSIGFARTDFGDLFEFDNSDDISADHIANKFANAAPGTLAVVDCLQMLDQKRANPDLMSQVRALRQLARDKELILVFISQIDRSYDSSVKAFPDLADVRLPNPLDLTLFTKTCFLSKGEARFGG